MLSHVTGMSSAYPYTRDTATWLALHAACPLGNPTDASPINGIYKDRK
jgi:hypothetical protein